MEVGVMGDRGELRERKNREGGIQKETEGSSSSTHEKKESRTKQRNCVG